MDVWRRVIWKNIDLLLSGFWVTVEVCVMAFALAFVVGLAVCLVGLYVRPLRWLASGYIQYCRNTPLLAQLMWVNYVWPELFGWPNSFFVAGCIGVALQSSGYLAETFRAGIQGIPHGHIEAARSIGMSGPLTLWRIVLPQTLLVMAPAIMNQVIIVVKSSTLVSVVAVPDLMYQALRLTNVYYEPIEILSFTAFIYIGVIFCISHIMKYYSDRFLRKFG